MKTYHTIFLYFLIIIFLTNNSFTQNHPRLLIEASDIPIIKAKVENPMNTKSYQLYQQFLNYVSGPANHTSSDVDYNQVYYGYYSNVAFASLLHNDINIANQWKDNMVNLAINEFNTDFDWALPNITGCWFHASIFTIATALIYDYCYDRLDQTEKEALISRIKLGMDYISYPVLVPDNHYGRMHSTTHSFVDAGYVLGAIAIGGDSPVYSLSDLNNDLTRIKYLLFGDDPLNPNPSPFFKYGFGNNGVYIEELGYSSPNLCRIHLTLFALSKFENTDYYNKYVVREAFLSGSKWLASSVFTNRSAPLFFYNALCETGRPNEVSGNFATWLVLAEKYQDGLYRWVFDEAFGPNANLHYLNKVYPETYICPLIVYNEFPPTPPNIEDLKTYTDFGRGLLYWRTGWNQNDMMFSIESTPAYQSDIVSIRHNQSDKGSITLTAYGNNFIYDRGGNNQAEKKTENNNYINIDGKGESNYKWFITEGELGDYEEYSFYSSIKSINKSAFDKIFQPIASGVFMHTDPSSLPIPFDPEAIFNPVLKADRLVTYFKASSTTPYYFWVIDEIQKDDQISYEYDWHIHTRTTNIINDASNPIKIYRNGLPANLDIFVIRPTTYSTVVSFVPGNDNPLEEILEPEVEVLGTPTNKLQILQNSVDGHYNILLVPYTIGIPTPNYTNLQMSSGSGVNILWSTNYEDNCFYSSANNIASGVISSNSKQVFTRKNLFNKYNQFFALNGSQTTFNGEELVNLYGQIGDVIYDSLILKIYGNNITNAKIYAPYAINVELNDEAVNFSRVNDHIYLGDFMLSGIMNIERDLIVTEGITATITSGSNLDFYNNSKLIVKGNLNATGTYAQRIIFDFEPAEAPTPNCILVDQGGNATIKYCDINNAKTGIKTYYGSVYIESCNIINCEDYGIFMFGNSPPVSQLIGNNIVNTKYGISVSTVNSLLVKENFISNTELGISIIQVPNVHIIGNNITSNLNLKAGIFFNNSNGYIRDNLITGHTRGVSLANSSPKIGTNIIIGNSRNGIYSASGSVPDLRLYLGSSIVPGCPPYYYTLSGCNDIIENCDYYQFGEPGDDGSEIFLYESSILMDYGNNRIIDDREIEPPDDWTLLLMNGYNIKERIEARYNWWGERELTPERFGDLTVTYEPLGYDQCPPPITQPCSLIITILDGMESISVDTLYPIFEAEEFSEMDEKMAIGDRYFLSGDYSSAEATYSDVVEDYPDSIQAFLASVQLQTIKKLSNADYYNYNTLQNFYTQHLTIITDTLITKMIENLITLCYIGMEEYLTAIERFDEIINQNPGEEEAIYAEIDAITTALLANNSGTLGKYSGKHNISSSEEYEVKLNMLLTKVGIEEVTNEKEKIVPSSYNIYQNFPNPFNPTTSITFDLPETEMVEIKIYDILGREITTLISETKIAGRYTISFDATNLSSGIYFYKIKTNSFNKTKKMILLR